MASYRSSAAAYVTASKPSGARHARRAIVQGGRGQALIDPKEAS
jgi:hypothetical protein